MKIAALAMLALYGCGGSSFTAADSSKDGGDAMLDADARSEASVGSGSVDAAIDGGDSSSVDSSSADASSDSIDTPANNGDACMAFDGGTVQTNENALLCVENVPTAQVPAQYVLLIANQSASTCGARPTPPPCQCAGAYTCACIQEALGNSCGALGLPQHCLDGNVVTVVCGTI
jgi:hypothetical protein